MDMFDQATAIEERQRDAAIAIVRSRPARDFESEICTGCSYATKTNWGKRCEAYVECLHDLQRREKAAR